MSIGTATLADTPGLALVMVDSWHKALTEIDMGSKP